MRVTVNLDERILDEVKRLTGGKTIRGAVNKALEEVVQKVKAGEWRLLPRDVYDRFYRPIEARVTVSKKTRRAADKKQRQ